MAGIIIIVVVAVILFGGVFAYQYFVTQKQQIQTAGLPVQSQQATEGWKTYTNTKYGFEFKYPTGVNVSAFQPGDPNTVLGLQISGLGNGLIFVGETADGNKTLQETKNQFIATRGVAGVDPETKLVMKDFFIGNSPAISVSFTDVVVGDNGKKSATPQVIIQTFKNNYYFVMEASTAGSRY